MAPRMAAAIAAAAAASTAVAASAAAVSIALDAAAALVASAASAFAVACAWQEGGQRQGASHAPPEAGLAAGAGGLGGSAPQDLTFRLL